MGGLVRYAGDGMGGRLQPLAACGATVAGGVAPAELLASSVPCPHLLGSLPPLVRCGCGRALVRGFGEQGDGQASRETDKDMRTRYWAENLEGVRSLTGPTTRAWALGAWAADPPLD
jgi:hypothetical protein